MKTKKIILIAAGLLMLFGAVISGIASVMLSKASEDDVSVHTKTVTDSIEKINISVSDDDIRIIPVDSEAIKVTYTTGKTKQYNFSTDNGTLSLETIPIDRLNTEWYDFIDFNFDDRVNCVTIEVPVNFKADTVINTKCGDIYAADLNGSMNIKADTGDVKIERSTFSKLECDLDYGDIGLEKVTAESIMITNDCGDIEVGDVSGNLTAYCDYGDIDVARISGNSIALENDCGDIEAEEVLGNLTAKCDYGDIDIGRISGSSITLENNCGDIDGTILGSESDYTVNAKTNLGDTNIQNRTGGKNTLNVKTDLGDIFIKFVQ